MSNETCACSDHPPCDFCGRPMRERKTLIGDHPGTVILRRAQTCQSCAYAQKQGKPAAMMGARFEIGTPCQECGRPMRPQRARLVDGPGTIIGYDLTICVRDKLRRDKGTLPKRTNTEIIVDQHQRTTTHLDAYMTSRRRRGIPITGLRKTA